MIHSCLLKKYPFRNLVLWEKGGVRLGDPPVGGVGEAVFVGVKATVGVIVTVGVNVNVGLGVNVGVIVGIGMFVGGIVNVGVGVIVGVLVAAISKISTGQYFPVNESTA